jgi:hypothetical protein
LTNACAVISFEVAQYALAHNNFPCDTVLAGLIEKSANKTRFMRQKLNLVPDKYEEIDLDEMLHVIAGLYKNITTREPFVQVFPRDNHNPVNFLTWSTFHGLFTNEDFFKLLQERVEATIQERGICALSFYLRSHYITGYFDTQVLIFLFVTYLLAHIDQLICAALFLHCSRTPVKKSQFIDSQYNDFWSNTTSSTRHTRANSAGPFGARVEHDAEHDIGGFMNCLRWYIESRTINDDYTAVPPPSTDVLYILYGGDSDEDAL